MSAPRTKEEGRPLREAAPQTIAAARSETDSSALHALERLRSYRTAAQAVRREPTRIQERLEKLIHLREAADRERDRFVRETAEAIIFAQASWILEGEEYLKTIESHDPILNAARRLRQRGLEHCPECQQRLSDPSDWQYWRALRQSQLDRLKALDRLAASAA